MEYLKTSDYKNGNIEKEDSQGKEQPFENQKTIGLEDKKLKTIKRNRRFIF